MTHSSTQRIIKWIHAGVVTGGFNKGSLYGTYRNDSLEHTLNHFNTEGHHIQQVIITDRFGGMAGGAAQEALIIINEKVKERADIKAPMFTILRSLKNLDMVIYNDYVYHFKEYENHGEYAYIVEQTGDAPTKVLTDSLSLPLREGAKVTLKSEYNKKVYDFGYYSATKGHAVCYEEGERNMQDSFSTLISNIQPVVELTPATNKTF